MEFPKKGIYCHFKGNRYELLDFARHSETMEWMVVYRALYGDCGVWVRPLSMWTETVERDGRIVPRFQLEETEETMLADFDDAPPPEWPQGTVPVGDEALFEDAPTCGSSAHGGKRLEQAVSPSNALAAVDSSDKRRILKQFYGYDDFREGQEEVVDAILSGRDTLAVMPTGAGKSVCYQIPALMLPGVTLVVSPLISLMKDQVQALKQNGISAAYLNSSLTERQFNLALGNAVRGQYRVIYVAPERLLTPRFLSAAADMNVSLVAVDEAHCISQWGQDFRPSYLTIPEFLSQLPRRPVVGAFTATATQRVRDDIRKMLALENPFVQITGFDRKNLYYSVAEAAAKDDALLKVLSKYAGMPGIVYCATRKKVESVCELLLSRGYPATRYHAGLSDEERQRNQDDFIYDRREIMVATNAFGMGIDKSNVRFIIHYNMPRDIESYYQEAGRAGRDGERADCHLLFGRQDILTQQFFIDHMGEEAGIEGEALARVQESARKRLDAMIRYCQTPDCLRRYVLRYFGEDGPENCGFCINCLNPPRSEDVTEAAKAVLRCVDQTGERFGRTMILEVLRGSESERVRQFRLDRMLSYGALSSMPKDKVSAVIDRLQEMDALTVQMRELSNGRFPILCLGHEADGVLSGETAVQMLTRAAAKKSGRSKKPEAPLNVDRDLFARLSALRKQIARTRGIPPYVVFTDAALRGMADRQPSNKDEMSQISGVGVVKLREFGDIFLREIQKYKDEEAGK